MASSTQSSPSRLTIDICVSGYILTEKMVRHLCLLQYGATEAQLHGRGPIEYSFLYFEKRKAIDAPYFIPLTFHDRDDPTITKDLWLLPGKAAFFSPGVTPPNLPLDKETKAYLDHWFPPKLLGMEEFRGLRYIQTIWPQGLLPIGIVGRKMKLIVKRHRVAYKQLQRDWIEWMKSKGVENPVMPPLFPVSWHLALP